MDVMSDFLNPKSMLTPGVAGALMMFLANAVCAAFPEAAFRYVALGMSFALGLVVFQTATIRFGEKATYWLLNSLIIFSTGVGASNIAANIEQAPRSDVHAAASAKIAAVVDWFVADAAAQPERIATSGAETATTTANARRNEAADARRGKSAVSTKADDARRTRGEANRSERPDGDDSDQRAFFRNELRQQGFFRRW